MKNYSHFVLSLLTIVLTACAAAFEPSPTTTQPDPTPATAGFILPAALYTLSAGQIWRLERDGSTRNQITSSATPIEDLDLSPLDSTLVYLTANTLVIANPRGGQPQVLFTGVKLPSLEGGLADFNDVDHIRNQVNTPRWSPDGRYIAFIHDGLKLLTVANRQVETLHPNDDFPAEGRYADKLVIAGIDSWSPDGKYLLLRTYPYPLTSIYRQRVALKTLGGSLSTLLEGSSFTAAWSDDSQTFILANAVSGGSDALNRCTPADARCTAIGQDVPARSAYFYAYPFLASSSKLFTFLATSPSPMQPPEAFTLYSLRPDGYGSNPVRLEAYTVRTALWHPGGAGVLVLTANAAADLPTGGLIWLPVDGRAALRLPLDDSRALRWDVK